VTDFNFSFDDRTFSTLVRSVYTILVEYPEDRRSVERPRHA
jgi:hypothetical protein